MRPFCLALTDGRSVFRKACLSVLPDTPTPSTGRDTTSFVDRAARSTFSRTGGFSRLCLCSRCGLSHENPYHACRLHARGASLAALAIEVLLFFLASNGPNSTRSDSPRGVEAADKSFPPHTLTLSRRDTRTKWGRVLFSANLPPVGQHLVSEKSFPIMKKFEKQANEKVGSMFLIG